MEVWIKKARLNPICEGHTVDGGVDSDLSTFVYVDFFDFETQSTQLHPGQVLIFITNIFHYRDPQYNL